MQTRTIAIISVVLCGCAVTPVPPATLDDAYGTDAYHRDTGAVIVYPDMGHDGGTFDAADAHVDTNAPDLGPLPDSGVLPPNITLDGQFDDPIWRANPSNTALMSTLAATAPFDGDALTSFYYARDHDWLYLGLEGALASPSDAIVVYADTAPSPPNGVYQTQTGLMDHRSVVRSVLSNGITGTLEFQPEWGWGTSAMPIAATPGEVHVGWYFLSATGSFSQLTSSTRTLCTATACETYVALRALGIDTSLATPSEIHVIVRIGRPDPVGWANPAFPTSDQGNPQAVGTVTIRVAP